VTELEILHGVLNNPNMAGRAYFYFRSRSYAKIKAGDYLPASPSDRSRQDELKTRIRESGFPVTRYRNPEALARRLERDLWKLLNAQFPASSVPDVHERKIAVMMHMPHPDGVCTWAQLTICKLSIKRLRRTNSES
jgi:nephrocystin-3